MKSTSTLVMYLQHLVPALAFSSSPLSSLPPRCYYWKRTAQNLQWIKGLHSLPTYIVPLPTALPPTPFTPFSSNRACLNSFCTRKLQPNLLAHYPPRPWKAATAPVLSTEHEPKSHCYPNCAFAHDDHTDRSEPARRIPRGASARKKRTAAPRPTGRKVASRRRERFHSIRDFETRTRPHSRPATRQHNTT
ncbi:hypothetical protein LY78DRAFT_112800 [Colletotrichum sublineola]|nr:hypothetical protein LY78DRAFT_112800 [Colletotrichum sublineola]